MVKIKKNYCLLFILFNSIIIKQINCSNEEKKSSLNNSDLTEVWFHAKFYSHVNEQHVKKVATLLAKTTKLLNTDGVRISIPKDKVFETQVFEQMERNKKDLNRIIKKQENSKNGKTALHFAVMECNFSIVELLIAYKFNINACNTAGITPLHLACSYDEKTHYEISKILIKNYCNLEFKTKHAGWTALHVAASRGNLNTIKLLIDSGANINARTNNNETAYDLSIEYAAKEVSEYLLSIN